MKNVMIMPIANAAITIINFGLNNFQIVRMSVVSVFYVRYLKWFYEVYVARAKQDTRLEMNMHSFLSLLRFIKLNRTLKIFPVGGLLFYHRKIFVSGSWTDVLTGPPNYVEATLQNLMIDTILTQIDYGKISHTDFLAIICFTNIWTRNHFRILPPLCVS